MRKWTIFTLFCALLLVVGGCRTEKKSLPSGAVATIGGESIMVEVFKGEMAKHPGRFAAREQKEALLEKMVRSKVLYAAAQKAGYDKSPEILAGIKRMIANKFREDNLSPRLDKITVTDKEVEQYYREHKGDFITEAAIRAAIIQVTLPSGASEEKKAQLAQRAETARDDALKQETVTRSFGSVAVKYSDDQATRYRGGDTGWLKRGEGKGRWDKKVIKTLFSLSEAGEVSPVITTPAGFFIVKLMEVKKSAPQPFAQVKGLIRYQIMNRKKEQVEADFYQRLKRRIPVKINNTLLSAIEAAESGTENKQTSPPPLPGV